MSAFSSITKPDYKNLNKNDIEDMYLLIMNGKVPDYAEIGLLWSLSVFIRSSVIWERVHDFQLGNESYQQKVNLTTPTISFPGVGKHKMFSIIYEPVHGIIYKNSKKKKRVMRHSEIHKDLTNEEVEYLKLFEEEIEQQALGEALVSREQCLRIGNCNYRLSTTFKPKEPTFQVALDVLSLTPFYQAFLLIFADVPAIYMHEFWATVSYHKHTIKFKMNKKSYSFDMETFREMLQICPNHPGKKFEDPPFKEEILTFMKQLGYSGNIKSLSDVKVETLPQPWRTFITIINKCLSGKQPAKGLETLSEITLTEAEQMEIVLERSKTQKHISHASGSGADEGTGVKPGVPNVPSYDYEDEEISWKSSDDESDDDASKSKDDQDDTDDDDQDDAGNDSEQTESNNDGDEFVHPKFTTHDEEDKEEDSFDPRVQTPSHYESTDDEAYDDVSQSGNAEEEKMDDEQTNEEEVVLERRDTEITDAPPTNLEATQATKETHVIITAIAPEIKDVVDVAVQLKTDKLREDAQTENQDFINNLDAHMQKIIKEQVKAQVKNLESHAVAAKLSELELKKILINKMEKNKSIDKSDL
ncbi:hypothetical protein Tco_0167784 [Tanacetum coccineum]